VKQETTNKVSASLNLPAQTVVAIDSADGTIKVTLNYDCPIAITYKVAIFSLSGCCYDDNIATRSFSTAGYWQKHFCSIFGNSNGDAQAEFYDRAVTFRKIEGYDETNGATYGWGKSRTAGTTAITVNKLNWGSIIGEVQEEKLDVEFSRECYAVEPVKIGENAEGNDILVYVQKSPPQQLYTDTRSNGVAGYDNQIEAPASIGELANYTLVTGEVWEWEDTQLQPVDNDFPTLGSTKVVYLYDNPAQNIVKFYYVLSDDVIDDKPANINPSLDIIALNVDFGSMVSKEVLANWLGKHIPMSSAGGVLTYLSRSMNTKINNVIPLYPLKNIELKEEVSAEYNMIEGDELEVNGLATEGFSHVMVPFFGFNQKYGQWILEGDPTIAFLKTDPLTGRSTLNAGNEEGTVYLKYVIDENKYTAHEIPLGDPKFATNDGLTKTAYVKINVSAKPFSGSIKARGSITGYVGESINLADKSSGVEAYVLDNTGMEIDVSLPLTWQKKRIDGLSIAGSILTFDEVSPNEEPYNIRAVYRYDPENDNTYSNWLTVEVLPQRQLAEINIADETDPPVLADYILDEGFNTFDLSWLTVSALDQYQTPWMLGSADLVWWYKIDDEMPVSLPNDILTVSEAGRYTIWAQCKDVKSNELQLLVTPSRGVAYIEISGEIGALGVATPNNSYDLSMLDIIALDQYGEDIALSANAVWEIVTGEAYANISGSILTGEASGDGSLRLRDGLVASNELNFSVDTLPYIKELFYADGADYVIEGDPYELATVALVAKNQWGEEYVLTKTQIDNIVWGVTAEHENMDIDIADLQLSGSILLIAKGAIPYAETATAILTAEIDERGDGQPTGALFVTLKVRQAPVPADLKIGLVDDKILLREGNTRLVSEIFTVLAHDQYGMDYPLTTADVDWHSDNTNAIEFSHNSQGDLVVIAVTEDESANITASVDINKYGVDPDDYKVVTPETVLSNFIKLDIHMPRRVTSISVKGAPEAVDFGSEFNVNNLTYTVYDQLKVAFTANDLQNYPASVSYSINHGNTGTTYNADSGKISFGTSSGTVTVIAMVVNSSSGGPLAQTSVNILLRPIVITFNANGGTVTPATMLPDSDGKLPSLPIPEQRNNYRFEGWFTAA
ncbi:MAG: InlB B-repeat-containing protein, partial [Clostridiales bacterium]|nr:InlB B-repeat-containing protein [Clostridiales bacterium]